MKLYHASPHKSLRIIKPQPTLSNDEYIGDYVFATANFVMALMYLVPVGMSTLMNPDGQGPTIVICSDPASLRGRDKGGAIYELPSASFTPTPQAALNNYEMASTHPVRPTSKQVFASVLEVLLSAGIKVKFVDEKTFKSLVHNPRQKEIISSLDTYTP